MSSQLTSSTHEDQHHKNNGHRNLKYPKIEDITDSTIEKNLGDSSAADELLR
jgi:hypothetical protein